MQDLFRILPALLAELPDNEAVRRAAVFAAWRRIAGEQLSSHTAPVNCIDKRLVVAVSGKTWQRHLTDLSPQMIFKLNSALGSAVVTYIEFVIDSEKVQEGINFGASDRDLRAKFAEESAAEITAELCRAADEISDDNIRRAFLLAAGNCLARKRKMTETQ